MIATVFTSTKDTVPRDGSGEALEVSPVLLPFSSCSDTPAVRHLLRHLHRPPSPHASVVLLCLPRQVRQELVVDWRRILSRS